MSPERERESFAFGVQVGCNVVGTKKPLHNGAFFSHFGLNSGKIEGIGLICKGLKILRERSHIGSNPITRTIINERDFQKSLSFLL